MDFLTLVGEHTRLVKAATTRGGEYAGPCPFCGGRDRFRVWPSQDRWWCRQCEKSGDSIAFRVEIGKITPQEAGSLRAKGGNGGCRVDYEEIAPPEIKQAPSTEWQKEARVFVNDCRKTLWSSLGEKALEWLRGRGLKNSTILDARLGFNPNDRKGMSRGITIPWFIGDELWRVNIRRPTGEPKYLSLTGSTIGLFNSDSMATLPVVIVEGEIDCLSLIQEAGDIVAPVATGSTGGSRDFQWIASLAKQDKVFLAFDSDEAGDKAASWWLDVLGNAKRWKPLLHDVNAMLQAGVNVRAWIIEALCNDLSEGERYAFEERAAIMEYDGGISRKEAEKLALSWRGETRS